MQSIQYFFATMIHKNQWNILLKINSYKLQFVLSVCSVMVISVVCFFATHFIGYKVVALILLTAVSILAMLFQIIPVLIAALLSAVIWNFFFIPPVYTFHINNAEDLLMFFLYFAVALINAVLTFKIKQAEKKARDKEEKENTIKLYNTLLNSLSHELRTPIATIIGSVDTLKENSNNLSTQHTSELLNELEIAVLRLNRQVENLLNMSRLETGSLQLKKDWCDVNELIFSVIQQFYKTTSHHIIFNHNEGLPLFKLDIGLIEQVLQNIIYNAINYTPLNTTITILVKHQQEKCCIVITDNGNGFPEEEMQLVFDKFYRLPNTKTGGTGLGLSIVKGFVEAHNGIVALKKNEPTGAFFTIQIPAETSYINNFKNE